MPSPAALRFSHGKHPHFDSVFSARPTGRRSKKLESGCLLPSAERRSALGVGPLRDGQHSSGPAQHPLQSSREPFHPSSSRCSRYLGSERLQADSSVARRVRPVTWIQLTLQVLPCYQASQHHPDSTAPAVRCRSSPHRKVCSSIFPVRAQLTAVRACRRCSAAAELARRPEAEVRFQSSAAQHSCLLQSPPPSFC